MDDLSIKRKQIVERFPIIPFTGSSSLFSTVRRMRAEQAWGIPLQYRTGFAISTEHGVAANELPETQWEQFYRSLCDELEQRYPDLYRQAMETDVSPP